jgi:hypothetical protein
MSENGISENNPSVAKKKLGLPVIIGTITAIAVGGITSKLMKDYIENRKLSDIELNKIASELNKSLPMMVDRDTKLKTTVGINGSIKYIYDLVNYSKADFDTAAAKSAVQPMVTKAGCSNPDSRRLLNSNVNMEYIYSDYQSQYLFSFVVSKKICEALK